MILDLNGISSRSLAYAERPLNAIFLGALALFDIVCFSLSPLAPRLFLTLLYADAGVPAVDLDHDGDRCNTDAPLSDRLCLLFRQRV